MNVTARIASMATLALAAVPFAALSTASHAQTAPSGYTRESVRIGDLNLASVSGKATFDHRVDHAVRHFCSTEKNLSQQTACQTAVRAEANEKAAANVQFASRN